MSSRVEKIASHLNSGTVAATSAVEDPPVVKDLEGRMSVDPINFLIENSRKYPGCFKLERSPHQKFIVVSDVNM